MRILIITNLYPRPQQPTRATFNRNQFAALNRDHELRILAPVAWTDRLNRRSLRWERVESWTTPEGAAVDHPTYWFPPKVLRGMYGRCFERSIANAFHAAVDDFRPEAVLSAWAYPDGWATVRLAHRRRLPAVVKVHGSDLLLLRRGSARERQTSDVLRSTDAVIAVGQGLARRAVQLGANPETVDVIAEGVDRIVFYPQPHGDARRRLGLDPNKPAILFVGALREVKGCDVLIEACARLRSSGQSFHCYLVGAGEWRRRLERQVDRLNLQDRITLVGPVPQEALVDWYAAATVFVLPSRSEGIPNVLREAAACGRPFVASAVGGIPELCQELHGATVAPDDPRSLADALLLRLESGDEMIVPPRELPTHAAGAKLIGRCLETAAARFSNRQALCMKTPSFQ